MEKTGIGGGNGKRYTVMCVKKLTMNKLEFPCVMNVNCGVVEILEDNDE